MKASFRPSAQEPQGVTGPNETAKQGQTLKSSTGGKMEIKTQMDEVEDGSGEN